MAWRRYLTATRASTSATYPIVEEAAWLRLQEDLVRFRTAAFRGPTLGAEQAAARAPADPRG
jgi:hypothetical protein